MIGQSISPKVTMTVLEIPTPDPRGFDDTSRPFVEAVASRYAIKRLIGRGGMGIVYLARDRRLERLVAIKTLPPQLAADESVKQRFLREIRTAGAMSHPNVVPIHGADEIDGHVFFVMGFVDGESLAAMIRGLGRIEPMDTARILRDVSAALTHAHARGIIHRDIKAENILVERVTGKAMVTDFGIARLAEAGPLTATGQLLGTVYYVSPEQVAGEKIDARSDIYSLGVAGFFALTGTFPFDAELASAVLVAHVNRPAPPVRTLAPSAPPALAAIIDRCLAKIPGKRFESAEQLTSALETFIASGGRPSRPQLISDTEAQAVWQRAASLQASSGTNSLPIPAERDRQADALRTSGHAVNDVRDAGREAGITTRYLDRALVERGLAPPRNPTRVVPQQCAWWAGAPLQIIEHTESDGELDPARFDSILNLVRDGTGEAGSIVASRRELNWRADALGSAVTLAVVPAEGRTTIRIAQHIRGLAAMTTAATLFAGTIVAPFVAVAAERIMQRDTPRWARALGINLFLHRSDTRLIAMGIGLLAVLAAIPAGRALNRWISRVYQRRVHLLTEAVLAKTQLAIKEDQEK
jgi:serine/threonine-protein kinase